MYQLLGRIADTTDMLNVVLIVIPFQNSTKSKISKDPFSKYSLEKISIIFQLLQLTDQTKSWTLDGAF